MNLVTKMEDMPSREHYVVMVFTSRHVPGDQRSKDSPGHGYPGHDVPGTMYYVTENIEEWKMEITSRALGKQEPFVAFKAGPLATFELRAEVKIKQQ